jgi:hypothetical protein
VQIKQVANNYDEMDLWAADETQDPVKIYSSVKLSVPVVNGTSTINKLWLEFNTSTAAFVRGDLRDFVAYVRNVVALQNVANPTSLLQRPAAGATTLPPVQTLPPNQQAKPAAPTNLRIITS